MKERIKLVLFTNDMILYIRKLYRFNTTPQKNLIRTNEFCKVAEYKINTHKNQLHFYTLVMKKS